MVPRGPTFGQMLFLSWMFSSRPAYMYHPYGYGYTSRAIMAPQVMATTRTTTRTTMRVAPVAKQAQPSGYTIQSAEPTRSRLRSQPAPTGAGMTDRADTMRNYFDCSAAVVESAAHLDRARPFLEVAARVFGTRPVMEGSTAPVLTPAHEPFVFERRETEITMAATKMAPRLEWQTDMIRLTVLYRLAECGANLSLITKGEDHEFIDYDLNQMNALDLIEADKDRWVITHKGRSVIAQTVAMFDQCLKFEIFGACELNRTLEEYERQDANPFLVVDNIYDPRFLPEGETSNTSEDLRIAMLTYLSEKMSGQLGDRGIDPHRIIFIQKLISGQLQSDQFWFALRVGTFFTEVEAIVAKAYQWRDICKSADGKDDEAAAAGVMDALYTAGMMEQRKRDGYDCGKCQTPLAAYQLAAQNAGTPFKNCPNPECKASFSPPKPQGAAYECPCCKTDVYAGDRTCGGCGACLDYSMPAGSISETTTETTTTEYEPVWGGYASYGYSPYGYYDVYNPFIDVLAFTCLVTPFYW
jgi:hypothetical protein